MKENITMGTLIATSILAFVSTISLILVWYDSIKTKKKNNEIFLLKKELEQLKYYQNIKFQLEQTILKLETNRILIKKTPIWTPLEKPGLSLERFMEKQEKQILQNKINFKQNNLNNIHQKIKNLEEKFFLEDKNKKGVK